MLIGVAIFWTQGTNRNGMITSLHYTMGSIFLILASIVVEVVNVATDKEK